MDKKAWINPELSHLDVGATALSPAGGPRVDGGVYENPPPGDPGEKLSDTYGPALPFGS